MIIRNILVCLLIVLAAVPAAHAQTADQFQPRVTNNLTATITIGTSTTLSNAVDLGGTTLQGIFVPAEFDGTTFGLQASTSLNGTYSAVQASSSGSGVLTITAAAGQYVPIGQIGNEGFMEGLRYIKIITFAEQTTTNTVFTLATKAK